MTRMNRKIMKKISGNETLIECAWEVVEDQITSSSACERIEWLISDILKLVKVDKAGWEKLFQDTADNRYWLLFYPQAELHGGGPACLMEISYKEATLRFNAK